VTLDEAFHGLKRLYVDTAPLIYYVETHPAYIDRMDAIIARLKAPQMRGLCSVITLSEVLTVPLRVGNQPLIEQYKSILVNNKEFRLISVDTIIAQTAASFRARYNLRLPDALQITTAIIAGCDAFLTLDLGLKRVTEIKIIVLDELTLDPETQDES
jgi:predicted nucleic acid-binding protein